MDVPTIRVEQAAADLAGRASLFLDVREPDEWDAGRIEGARHVPLAHLRSRLDTIPRDRRVIAVCRSGNRSGQATEVLCAAGFDAVNLGGGMRAWAAAGLTLDPPTGHVE